MKIFPPVDEKRIRSYISVSEACSEIDAFFYDIVASTNDLAKAHAALGGAKEAVFIANGQSQGRGSKNRSFFSPAGTGLYMSFLLVPKTPVETCVRLTCTAAVAVCEAIESVLNLSPKIKWVNDIYYDKKKVCGILTEGKIASGGDVLSYAVVGIGINVYSPDSDFPDELKEKAGALLPADSDEYIKTELCAAVLSRFFKMYREEDRTSFLNGYRDRSMLTGQIVRICGSGLKSYDGKTALVTGIDENFRLVVTFNDTTSIALSSGEVTVV